MKFTKQWAVDAAERIATTFAGAFVSAILADGLLGLSMSEVDNAAIAAGAAALSAFKALVAADIGNPNSASLVPSVGGPVALGGPVAGADQVVPVPDGPHHLVGPPEAIARVRLVRD